MAEVITTIKDIITALAAIAGLSIAWMGLTTWQRQLGGQQAHDLAQRLLIGVYKVRKALQGVRQPWMFNSEIPGPPADKVAAMSDSQIRFYGTQHAYFARWKRVTDVSTALEAELLEAEALWGDEFASLFRGVTKLESELVICVRHFLTLQDPDIGEESKDAVRRINEKRRDILYDLSEIDEENGADGYTSDLNNAVKAIEGYLKPKLVRASFLSKLT